MIFGVCTVVICNLKEQHFEFYNTQRAFFNPLFFQSITCIPCVISKSDIMALGFKQLKWADVPEIRLPLNYNLSK